MKDEAMEAMVEVKEDEYSLPKRGGKYVSDAEKENAEREERSKAEREEAEREKRELIERLHSYDHEDPGPFFWGEGSC